MKDLNYEKFAKLMGEIEALENEIGAYESHEGIDPEVVPEEELQGALATLRGRLASARNELVRVSAGCGRNN